MPATVELAELALERLPGAQAFRNAAMTELMSTQPGRFIAQSAKPIEDFAGRLIVGHDLSIGFGGRSAVAEVVKDGQWVPAQRPVAQHIAYRAAEIFKLNPGKEAVGMVSPNSWRLGTYIGSGKQGSLFEYVPPSLRPLSVSEPVKPVRAWVGPILPKSVADMDQVVRNSYLNPLAAHPRLATRLFA